jgi:hypothetical protein
MYYILDLRTDLPSKIEGLEFYTEQEALNWINENGDATIYTVIAPLQ